MIAYDGRVARRLADALTFMRARIDAPPRLDEVAAVAGFSPFHFHRIFRAAFGEGPAEFVVRHRLERAAYELRTTRKTVTQIAVRCGYETPSAFARAFAARYGMSPTAFRAAADGAADVPPAPRGAPLAELEVRTATLPAMDLLALRHVGPYSAVGPTWDALLATVEPLGLVGKETRFLGLSYDDPAEAGDVALLRYDACITVRRGTRVAGLRSVAFGGGKHALVRHRGPYELIAHVFDAMMSTLVLPGRIDVRDAPFVELYLNHASAASPAERETDLGIPVN
jgi:AraC family transcriptional regulator